MEAWLTCVSGAGTMGNLQALPDFKILPDKVSFMTAVCN